MAATQLAKNSVGAKQMKSNAVTSAKVKKDAVTTAKIKNGAVTTAKIANGAVTGAKVDLASLGTVPSATSAGNANTVNGRSMTKVFAKIAPNSTATIATIGVFKFVASCDAGGNVENLEIQPQTTDVDLAAFGTGNVGPIFDRNAGAFPNAISLDNDGTNNNERGISTFSASQSGGAVITGTLGYEDSGSFNKEDVCSVYGQVIP